MTPPPEEITLLFNLGGPETLNDVRPFLRELFSDPDIFKFPLQKITQPFFARMISRLRAPRVAEDYAKIGGGSPLRRHSEAQARQLQSLSGLPARVVMRYAAPRLTEALPPHELAAVKRINALPLYPHYSLTSTESSFKELRDYLQEQGYTGEVRWVREWYDHPDFLHYLAQHILKSVRETGIKTILFSAHSIPLSFVKQGDTYPQSIEKHVRLLTDMLQKSEPSLRTFLSYQSKVGPVAWVGPTTIEFIHQLRKHADSVIVVPLSFVSDHFETLFEINIQIRKEAERIGFAKFVCTPGFNEDTQFVQALAAVLETARRSS